MNNLMASFYRRAAQFAKQEGYPDLATSALLAATEIDATFSIGNVNRPGHNKARAGFVGQPTHLLAPGMPTGGTGVPLPPGGSSRPVPVDQRPIPVDQPSHLPVNQPYGYPYPCPPGMDPNLWNYKEGCPIDQCDKGGGVTMNCDTPTFCNYNLIGQNTLSTDGIAAGSDGRLVVTAGDSASFTPKYFYYEAQPFATNATIDITALPPAFDSAPVLMQDVFVGRISQLRRGGSPDVAIPQGAFSKEHHIVPVDWAPFTSTQEQNWSGIFYNPNGFTVHVFIAMWGDI